MGLATKLLKPTLKALSKRGHKTLAKNLYKYRYPVLLGGGAANVPFIDTPSSNDQDNFNNFYQKLVDEGLVKDEEGLNDGVLSTDDLVNYWNKNSYHNRNRGKSWAETILTEGSSFIPFAGIPISMGLGYAFSQDAERQDNELYQDIRRQAYKHRGMEAPEYNTDE
jgi:hypothetical protein